jgi:hypothetical protein
VPAIIIATIPKARWCTWTPLSLTTLPGHHGTRGLRISRVLIRMKEKESRKPTSTMNTAWLSLATIWSFQKSVKIEAVPTPMTLGG